MAWEKEIDSELQDFGPNVGQIDLKRDKSGTFKIRFQYNFNKSDIAESTWSVNWGNNKYM